jgi:hypothetical protein
MPKGVNGITRATPACFLTTLWELFLEYFWKIFIYIYIYLKSYYFINVYVKNLAKYVILKKIQIHLQIFLLLESKRYNV